MKYTSRGLRQQGAKDQWEATLSHTDPSTGETVRSYHTIVAKTRKQAEKRRDQLIVDLDAKVAAVSKVEESFDDAFGWPEPLPDPLHAAAPGAAQAITFTAEQLRAMLAEAERKEAAGA